MWARLSPQLGRTDRAGRRKPPSIRKWREGEAELGGVELSRAARFRGLGRGRDVRLRLFRARLRPAQPRLLPY